MKSEEKKVMSVAEVRAAVSSPKVITLSSGATIKIRRLTPLDYIKEGLTDIPNEFFKFISELSSGVANATTEEGKKNYEIFDKFLKISVEKGIIDPPCLLRYEKGKEETHLIFAEFSLIDQKLLMDVITGRV